MSSATPRTDAAKRAMSNIALIGIAANATGFVEIVPAVLAIKLERELAAALGERDRYRDMTLEASAAFNTLLTERDQLRAELAAEKRARANAEQVCVDALKKRDQAEADRDAARAELARARQTIEDVCCGGGA